MNITRRGALLGATAAAAITSVATTAPSAIKVAGVEAALVGEPVIGLAQQLRAANEAWDTAEHTFVEASRRVGFIETSCNGLVMVESLEGRCCWGAAEIRQAAEDGLLSSELRDVALAEIERQQREGQEVRRALGIEPLWQELERWNARFWDLQARLLDMPATTPRGVCAKLRGFYHDEEITQIRAGHDPENDLPAEWAASVYRDLERLSGALIPSLRTGRSGPRPTG